MLKGIGQQMKWSVRDEMSHYTVKWVVNYIRDMCAENTSAKLDNFVKKILVKAARDYG